MFGVGYGGAVGIRKTNSSPLARYIDYFDLIKPAPYSMIARFKILVNHSVVPHKIIKTITRAIIRPLKCAMFKHSPSLIGCQNNPVVGRLLLPHQSTC